MHIRIVATPPGEAPEHVRAAWIGLTLPLLVPGVRVGNTAGVLSGPNTRWGWFVARLFGRLRREKGYCVDSSRAIDALAGHSPDAAQWWRENVPTVVRPGNVFLFAVEVCQEVR
jgi:hypothetical protein